MKTKLAKSLSNVNVSTPSLVLESMASDNKWGILSEQQSKLKPVKKEEANYEVF